MHSYRVAGLVAVTALLAACAADDADPPAADTSGGTAAVDSTTGDVATLGASEGTAAGSGDSTGAEVPGIPASGGIEIDYIEANQGIGVKIGEDGAWVGPEGRTAPLAADRLTLVRVFWTVPDDWTPREIEAQITFYLPDDTTVVYSETAMVEGDSFVGSLAETFNFGLQAEDAHPGTGYAVELFEVDETYADAAVTEPPRLPADEESVLVGLESSFQKMKIMLVPFNYNGPDCVTEPDLTESTMQLYFDKMFQMNPIDTLELEIHETLDWNQELTSLSQINSLLSDLRFKEGAPPEMYYYGHIDACGGGVAGAAGLAFGIPVDPTMENAYQRVSSGVSFDPELSAETFVHEVGHSQGRFHIACDGEAGVDPSYPQPGGAIGEWGFGVIDFSVRHPTVTKDYMTYCTPTWVSNFGWNKVWPTIQTLSSWDPEFPGADASPTTTTPYGDDSLLLGILLANGEEIWQTVPGRIDPAKLTNDMQIDFGAGGERVALQNTFVETLPDTEDRRVVAPLPVGFAAADTLARLVDGKRIPIQRAAVSIAHTERTVRR